MSSIDDYEKEIHTFFNKLQENNLLLTDIPAPKFADKLKIVNYRHMDVRKGITKLSGRIGRIYDEDFTRGEVTELLTHFRFYEFVIQLESIKDTIVEMLNKEVLSPRLEGSALGSVLHDIVYKLHPNQDEDTKIRITRMYRKLFFVPFRNAVIHRKYDLDHGVIHYEDDNGEKISINYEQYMEMYKKLLRLELQTNTRYIEMIQSQEQSSNGQEQ